MVFNGLGGWTFRAGGVQIKKGLETFFPQMRTQELLVFSVLLDNCQILVLDTDANPQGSQNRFCFYLFQ